MEIRTGSSDSNSSRHESSSFNRVQRRSNESQYSRKKGSDIKRELEEKGISFLRKIRVRDTQKKRPNKRTVMPSISGCNFRQRNGRKVEFRPTMEMKTQQGGPVRARKSKGKHYSPYIEKQTRIPDKEVINNKRKRKGKEERILVDPSSSRS
ncbi:uncharacterized protein TNCV_4980851 [Trichonephila clavipes]|nr:uncharacterized protein TNCV_4980851 [Trichonephila clavipes]